MEVQLTHDQQVLVRQGVECGPYHSEADALRDALALWEERERCLAEIRSDPETAEAQAANGEGRRITSREESARLIGLASFASCASAA